MCPVRLCQAATRLLGEKPYVITYSLFSYLLGISGFDVLFPFHLISKGTL